MTTEVRQVRLPKLQPWQKAVLHEAARFNVLDVGRQAGKTVLGLDLAAQTAIDGKPCGFFTPTYKNMQDSWHALRDQLRSITDRASASERRLDLVTGGSVEFWSLKEPDTARGRKYARIIVDEAALVPDLVNVFNAVMRPMLVILNGDAWFLSTPKGRNGFWTLYQWGLDEERLDWRCWQLPSSVSEYWTPDDFEDARRGMPERIFAQEHLAEFLEDGGAVFRYVRKAATSKLRAAGEDGHGYVIGVDWGKSEDFTVMAVVDLAERRCVALDRSNRVDYAVQRSRLLALAERFQPLAIIAESNAMGEPIIEQLQRENLPVRPFHTSNASKAEIIDGLALAFERGDIAIPDDATLIGELEAYTAERLPSGLLRYGAPPGMHDDCVMALALAWYGASGTVEGSIMV